MFTIRTKNTESEDEMAQMQPNPKDHHKRSKLKLVLIIFAVLTTVSLVGLILVLSHMSKDLPDYRSLNEYTPPQMSRVLDRQGQQLGRFFEVRRTIVPFEEISPHMVHALLSAEDADFYEHQGLDYWGILRAIYNSLKAGRLKGSGSTITQQTVKNILLSQEKTLRRKIKEVILTRRIESRFSKDDILSMYLNTIYFGHGRYGIEEAAKYYFGIRAKDLNINQSAIIAGLIQSPERHSPRRHPKSALRRRTYVLREMLQNGYLSEDEHQKISALELGIAPRARVSVENAQWWVQLIGEYLSVQYGKQGLKSGGLTIKSTLDLKLQEAAQKAVKDGLKELDKRQKLNRPLKQLKTTKAIQTWLNKQQKNYADDKGPPLNRKLKGVVSEIDAKGRVIISFGLGKAYIHKIGLERLKDKPKVGDIYPVYLSYDGPRYPKLMRAHLYLPQAAFVALDPHTREVLAMVGGYSFDESSFNRAVQARRQAGSAFKPFVYGAALESRRFTLTTQLLDAPETWPLGGGKRWTPKNYNGKFMGPVLLKTALAKSINSVAVRLADAVGLDQVKEFAKRSGLQNVELGDSLTMALGSSELSLLDLVNAYASFAADGGYADPVMITGVDVNPVSALRGTKTALDWPVAPALTPALSEDVAWLIQRLLRGVVTEGSGRRLASFKGEVIGKTGTTNDAKDAWFIAALPNLSFGVWVGYDSPENLGRKEGGGRTAAPIALSFLNKAKWEAGRWRPQPEGITMHHIDPKNGLLDSSANKNSVESYFLKGTEPKKHSHDQRSRQSGQNSADSFLFGGGL